MKLQHQPTTGCEPAGVGRERAFEVGLMGNAVYISYEVRDLVGCAHIQSGRSEAIQPGATVVAVDLDHAMSRPRVFECDDLRRGGGGVG
jgi:hypothetical protein